MHLLNKDMLEIIQFLFDVIDLTAANEIPGFIFTADTFKAFNLFNWDFLFSVVLKYCFGSTILCKG